MNDIYSAPESDVVEETKQAVGGSVEDAIAGRYELSIGDCLSEGSSRMHGAKLYLQLGGLMVQAVSGAGVLLGVLAMAAFAGLGATLGGGVEGTGMIVGVVLGYLVMFAVLMAATMPAWTAWTLMGVQRSAGVEKLDPMITIRYFGKMVPLFGFFVLQQLVYLPYNLVGFIPDFGSILALILVIPVIYLSVAWMFAPLLIIEKNMSVLQAMETSRKAVSKRWFAVFGITLIVVFVNLLAIIPLGIGLIWSIPWGLIAMGSVYRNIFGVSEETMAA